MRVVEYRDRAAIARLIGRDTARDPRVARQAARIVADVRRRGDVAVRMWRRRLDDEGGPIDVPAAEMRAAWNGTPADVRAAIRVAIRHVRRVAGRQRIRPFAMDVVPGVRIEQCVLPFARVGCYVPAGRFPLPSTVVMTAIPAIVAGVEEVVVACPRPAPVILAAALACGVTRVLRVGGAQAIAALAYGTTSIPRVDKIVGPGSVWVAAAKRAVSHDVATDGHAGPSEVVIWSDAGDPGWIAADLVAQAEHDVHARVVLVTRSRRLARDVSARTRALAAGRPTARRAIARNGAAVVVAARRDAVAFIDAFAPEHLVCETAEDVGTCRTAGTIFIGRWSAAAAGDYVTGSNHVLPTGGHGRWRGGLSAADFVRVFTTQRLTPAGLRRIGPAAIAMARAEGLDAHAASIAGRLEAAR
jgi:histidinol dehydrogenase